MLGYKIKYWDDLEEKDVEDSGIIGGQEENFIKNLQDYYGKDNVYEITFYWFDSNIINKDELKDFLVRE